MTLKDVARVAGVSPATVSYVLSGKKKMSPDVVRKVEEAVRITNYQVNSAARALRTGANKTLGLMIPDITNPFFPHLAQEIKHEARANGYAVMLMDTSYDASTEVEDLQFLIDKGVDGLIWVPGGNGVPSCDFTVPAVIIDHETDGFSTIHADDFGGGRMQARYAGDTGHSRVALISGPQSLKSARERRRGFMEEAGNLDLILDIECPFDLTLPGDVEEILLSGRKDYTFIGCGNDLIAIAVMRSLKKAGCRIPEDISVIGFDNNMMAGLVDPPLTTINQPIGKISSLAVNMAISAIQNRSGRIESMVVPVSLKERESVRALNR